MAADLYLLVARSAKPAAHRSFVSTTCPPSLPCCNIEATDFYRVNKAKTVLRQSQRNNIFVLVLIHTCITGGEGDVYDNL